MKYWCWCEPLQLKKNKKGFWQCYLHTMLCCYTAAGRQGKAPTPWQPNWIELLALFEKWKNFCQFYRFFFNKNIGKLFYILMHAVHTGAPAWQNYLQVTHAFSIKSNAAMLQSKDTYVALLEVALFGLFPTYVCTYMTFIPAIGRVIQCAWGKWTFFRQVCDFRCCCCSKQQQKYRSTWCRDQASFYPLHHLRISVNKQVC